MSAYQETEVRPGDVLAGKYRIEQVLGRGGMGVVVAATHLQLDERVALKFLLPEALTHPEAVARFEREARAAVKIKSEHVARVTDVGKLENGSPYMVMEFLNGADLGQYLEQHGPLPIDEAVHYILQACEAIAEAHSLSIVHRDLKPANLFRILRADGTPSIKVLDFGISKVITGHEASLTQTSSMMGSPYYMSPEQMTSSKNVDHRTDVWALGVILHELLTGKVPYEGETIPEVCAKVLQVAPPDLTEFRKDAPWELQAVISRALAKKREDRYQNVAEFGHALQRYGTSDASRSVERISRVLGVAPGIDQLSASGLRNAVAAAQTQSLSRDGLEASTLNGASNTQVDYAYSPPTHKRSPLVWLGLVVVLLGAGAVWAMRSSEPPLDTQAALVPAPAPATEPAANAPADAPSPAPSASAQPAAPPPVASAPTVGAPAQTTPAAPTTTNTATSASTKPASRPAASSKPAPSSKPRQAPRPASAATPAAVVAPSPAPAPPTQAPKPKSSSSLYLDRK